MALHHFVGSTYFPLPASIHVRLKETSREGGVLFVYQDLQLETVGESEILFILTIMLMAVYTDRFMSLNKILPICKSKT